MGVDGDVCRRFGAEGLCKGNTGDFLVTIGGFTIENGLGFFGARVENIGEGAAAIVEAGFGGFEGGLRGLQGLFGGLQAFLRGDQAVVSGGNAVGDFLVGLDEIGTCGELLLQGCVHTGGALPGVEQEVLEPELTNNGRNHHHAVAVRGERLGEGTDDPLVRDGGDTGEQGVVSAASQPELGGALLGTFPNDTGTGIIVLSEVNEFGQRPGVAGIESGRVTLRR